MAAPELNFSELKLGINGLGRIGKLTLWHHVGRKFFKQIVVNLGRPAGRSLHDIAYHYIERDSTYGRLGGYLYGFRSKPVISDIDEAAGTMQIDGVLVKFLLKHRNPREIGWQKEDVRLVVDTTGRFLDPSLPPEQAGGAVRGHLEAGAEKVVLSAPFKMADQASLPEDAITTVMGINDSSYDPRHHRIISNASCTTTCLAQMIKPLLNVFGPQKILSASMATVHAATSSQAVLDRLPKAGKEDLRKNRSTMNNIILTTTGAAKALRLVIPEMAEIGFIAESVRVPTVSGSLIILVVNLQDDPSGQSIRRNMINDIYRDAVAADTNGYLIFSERQNVSSDIVGLPRAAAIIEGSETHTRTAEVRIDLVNVPGIDPELVARFSDTVIRTPVTQAVIYGWYDNELGSYVNMLGDRVVSVAENM